MKRCYHCKEKYYENELSNYGLCDVCEMDLFENGNEEILLSVIKNERKT